MRYIKLFEELNNDQLENTLQEFIDSGYDIEIEDLSNVKKQTDKFNAAMSSLGIDSKLGSNATGYGSWNTSNQKPIIRNLTRVHLSIPIQYRCPSSYDETVDQMKDRQLKNKQNRSKLQEECSRVMDEIIKKLNNSGFDKVKKDSVRGGYLLPKADNGDDPYGSVINDKLSIWCDIDKT